MNPKPDRPEQIATKARSKIIGLVQLGFRCQVSGVRPATGSGAGSLIEDKTEVVCEGKLQITSSKLQINLKSQYQISETHVHFPGRKGNFDLGSMMK